MSGAGEGNNGQGEGGNGDGGAVVERPDYVPETFWNAETKTVKADEFRAALGELDTLKTFKTEYDTKQEALPKDATGYVVELPKEFSLPNGPDGKPLQFKPNDKDPLVASARDYAARHKLDQSAFSDLVGIWANVVVEGMKADATEIAATKTALGAKADERIGAAQTWAEGILGKDKAGAIAPLLRSKDGVEAIETIIAKMAGVTMGGKSGTGEAKPNEALVASIGTDPNAGVNLLREANSKKH